MLLCRGAAFPRCARDKPAPLPTRFLIKGERMDLYRTAETWTGAPGTIAPADGNTGGNSKYETRNSTQGDSGANFDFRVSSDERDSSKYEAEPTALALGP